MTRPRKTIKQLLDGVELGWRVDGDAIISMRISFDKPTHPFAVYADHQASGAACVGRYVRFETAKRHFERYPR